MLDVYNHQRDAANLTYIYPVLSRRAGGISVGINLNINRKCNWACVYCQVSELDGDNGYYICQSPEIPYEGDDI